MCNAAKVRYSKTNFYRLLGAKKPSATDKEFYVGRVEKGLEIVSQLMKTNGGYLAGDKPTIADFYAFFFIHIAEFANFVSLSDYKHVHEWYNNMCAIKEVAAMRKKYNSGMKMTFCMAATMLPMMNFMTCKCCKK